MQEPHSTHQTWFVARGEIWGLTFLCSLPVLAPPHAALRVLPPLPSVLVSLCLSEDVQVTEKITISKQFKEKVIRPILKVERDWFQGSCFRCAELCSPSRSV